MYTKLKLPSIRIESVSDFIKYIVELRKDGSKPTAFRGQRYYGWPMQPKLFREDEGIFNSEDLAVRDIISIHPQEFEFDKSMFDKLVRMQHFGLPTRLVDVTTNPLVALWFATEPSPESENQHGGLQSLFIPRDRQRYYDSDRVSCMANLANLKVTQKNELFKAVALTKTIEEFNEQQAVKLLAFYVGFEKPNFLNIIKASDLVLPVYVKPKMSNKRIIAQSGAFMLFGSRGRLGKGREPNVKSERVWIHEDDKAEIRDHLQLLGIHESALFPEIDKTAKFISIRYGNERRDRNVDSLI
ncbi:FRG domain-containing protein [Phytobacter sp. V91]|uniref:FRG domain-containing protein n=1 Tax=Phytobacter sp. V91 TaxID=3369425 RepID=UPI003F60AB0C